MMPNTSPCHDLATVLARLRDGYYVHFNRDNDCFQWKRDDTRTIIKLDPRIAPIAKNMLEDIPAPFELRMNDNPAEVLRHLGDDRIKPQSWVRGEVVEIYQLLNSAGYLKTFEAYQGNTLVGAVLGIELPRVFFAETMFRLTHDASKFSLCNAVLTYHDRGYAFIDVFTPHPVGHPATRLGERTMCFAEYEKLLGEALS
jgi:leucyl/phenylalanyl-tRNA--protein transferase